MTDPAAKWARAKQVAEYIVRDWMHLEADERTMSVLVKEIEGELDKAFDDGMKAVVGFSQPLIRAATLEEAAALIETYGEDYPSDGDWLMRGDVAAKLRALKEQP